MTGSDGVDTILTDASLYWILMANNGTLFGNPDALGRLLRPPPSRLSADVFLISFDK